MGIKAVIFKEEMSRYIFNMNAGTFVRLLLLGLVVGMFAWALAIAMDRYMISPFFCGNDASISVCLNSTVIGGNIATVLMGIMAVPLLAALRTKRALLVALAAVISLWGIAGWVAGPWYVSLLWTMAVYALVYATLGWLNRLRGNGAAIFFMALFVLLARLVIIFS